MNGTALLAPPAGPSPLLPRLAGGVWEGKRGAEPGPTSLFRLLAPRGDGGARGLYDAADTLRPPFLAVSRGRPLPEAGRGAPPTRRALPPGRASAFRLGPLVAPGALRVVAQVPEAEQVLSSPVPRELPLGVARCGGALWWGVGWWWR